MNKVIFLVLLIFSSSFAQRTMTLDFDLYQTAANRILLKESNFPLIFSGSVSGNSYYFELGQPSVEFSSNYMKMIAVLKINTAATGLISVTLQPSIYVNYSLSTDNITAFLQEFPNYINTNLSQIPQWIRDKIIEHYQSIGLEMYPAKLLDYAESFIPGDLDIEVSNIGFSIQSLSGKLKVSISFTATGTMPYYQLYTYNHSQVKLKSNVNVNIKRLTVGNLLGQIYYDYNGNTAVSKDQEAVFNVYNENNWLTSESGRYVRVLLQSDVRGTFLRRYSAAYLPDNNQWYGPRNVGVSID